MPKKLLNGKELAGYIQERQGRQVRSLRQADSVIPRLAIIQTKDDPVIHLYVRLKRQYGAEIGVEVDSYFVSVDEAPAKIDELNKDTTVHGVIVQLPLSDTSRTDEILQLVDPKKDVDALASTAFFDPATPTAILWLLAGYNVDLRGKKILLIGKGKLVGKPLEAMLRTMDHDVEAVDRETEMLDTSSISSDVIITATGSPALLFPDMIKQGAVVVDAGVASEDGKTVGDVAPEVYERDDVIITPVKGGVGPLTVCALFDNVIRSARRDADTAH